MDDVVVAPCGRSGTLLVPTSGAATVAGIPLAPENGVEIRRRISIMPEFPGLYLRLSVLENLECFADLYEADDASDRIDRALRSVNLALLEAHRRYHARHGRLLVGLPDGYFACQAPLNRPEIQSDTCNG